jgi:hypothetical protein
MVAAAQERLLTETMLIGNSLGMTSDAMASRLRNETDRMKTLINNDCINVASLLNRHAMRCKQVAENPDCVLVEYMKKDR